MTSESDRPGDTAQDPILAAAWRAQPRETPSPALDAAILAAAHRAVASTPRPAGSEALRPPRWWLPFAAAAVIGVVAVGLVQLASRDVLDVVTPSVAPSPTPPVAAPEPAPAPVIEGRIGEPAPADAMVEAPARARQSMPPAPVDAAAGRSAPSQPAAAPPTTPPATPPATSPATPPAAPPATPPATAASAPPAAESTKPSGEAMMGFAKVAPDAATAAAARAGAVAPTPTAPRGLPPSMPQREAASTGATPLAKRSPGAMTRGEADERARDPAAWIERIGKLHEAGRDAEALAELREFDALVPDARQRLPAELRRLLERGSNP